MPHQLFSAKVEPVTPAADTGFMNYVLGIPESLKRNHKIYIDLLRQQFPFLTEVPVRSGGSVFHFDTDEMPTRYSLKTRLRRILRRTVKTSRFLQISLSRWISRDHTREYPPLPTGGRDSNLPPQLVIRVLEEKHFDRPFYNKRLLRRLFSSYRNGHVMYHHLFTLVFYIELWHLMFLDEDSPLLFEPRNTKLAEKETEQKP